MCASLETLVVAAYVFADSFRFPRPGPAGKVTDQELIALAVAQAVTGICSDRQFLGVIGRLFPGVLSRAAWPVAVQPQTQTPHPVDHDRADDARRADRRR